GRSALPRRFAVRRKPQPLPGGQGRRRITASPSHSMRVFAFRHAAYEDLGTIRPVLESRGVAVECVDLYTGAAPPDIGSARGLIFMGGPMGVNDGLPYLECETALIRQAAERGQPVLGVCLGAQLIAKALGGAVYRNAVGEVGWFPIELTSDAAADPFFSR